ncbi:aminotransferase class I/II-fold pyridoxal phosphate-dependent enzyme [Lentzea sp. NEAU-D13]|uniref:cysteine-S-conjugate beta-lyase n=1 Tax=Lentzea alba TaxID=2714351 RepID=A0A7C9VT42_9PSEU|nr:aminotransferase class I/II-fold pyridoxal phosphate-dependent enzyme [Lentzea alba]NGY63153.1 aminotransferase class I/II-fold pyridoxal phosphate-dependent enzyme [Lentzea alba]
MNQTTTTERPGTLVAGFDNLDLRWLRAKSGAKWRVPPANVLPAWVADMDFPVAEPIRRRLAALALEGDLGYPDWPDGRTPLREVFSARMGAQHEWHPDCTQVREFTDVTQAVQVVLQLATAPGDGVALHTPCFAPFARTITRMGRRLVPIPAIDTDDGWVFDTERFAADVAATGCRVLLLVNPHNPTGRVFTEEELRALAEVAHRHDLLVISDEIHSDLVYAPHRHLPFAALGQDVEARTVTVTSATKAFNLAGVRCAVAHVGPSWLRDALAAQPSDLFGVAGLFGVHATIAAWTECDEWLSAAVGYLDDNRRMVADFVAESLPGVRWHVPEATYLAWLDFRAAGLGDDPAELVRRHGRVELSPGPSFNPGGDGFARLNFATSRRVLRVVLERLGRSVEC